MALISDTIDFVKISGYGEGYTIVQLKDGRKVKRTGARNWRNNNPGNIENGNFARKYGSLGSDGRFAVFPNYKNGRFAKSELLFNSDRYKGKTIEQAMHIYAPSNENDTNKYITTICNGIGLPRTYLLSNMSNSQKNGMLDQMEKFEGFKKGKEEFLNDDIGTDTADNNINNEEQPTNPGSSNNNNTAPGGSVSGRIENIFKSSILLNPIEIDIPSDNSVQQEMMRGIGYMPFVWYNSYQIVEDDIEYLSIYFDGIAPCLKIKFNDTLGLMFDAGFPLDDSKIRLYLNPKSNSIEPIYMEFKITNFKTIGDYYLLTGILNVSELFVKKYKSYSKMSSNKALQEISKEIGLGFNTNITDTNDTMTWINSGDRVYNFMNDILSSSYISDEAYLYGYIDFYYNFNYVDVEKELNRVVDDEKEINAYGLEDVIGGGSNINIKTTILTNDPSMENSNSFFYDYEIINNSTSISLERGYLDRVKFYSEVEKDLLIFDVDSLTSDGSKSIVLKGQPQDLSFYKININPIYVGKMDTSNTHRNYNYSIVQNSRNLDDLEKIGMVIHMGIPNYAIYKFQKIMVMITNSTSTPSNSLVNNRLSGAWLVTDVRYDFKDGILDQVITLVKRELSLSPEELANEDFKSQDRSQYKNSKTYEQSQQNPDNLEDIPDLVENVDSTEQEARVRAFLRMIRVGEGTVGRSGYEKLFGGKSFIRDYGRTFATHPQIKITGGGYVSSAAGAYQIMGYTFNDLKKYMPKYGIKDFSPLSQDMLAIVILKHLRPGSLRAIIKGDIATAVAITSAEWASLPVGPKGTTKKGSPPNSGKYGQPNKSYSQVCTLFNSYLEQEKNGKTDLYIKPGFLKIFGYG